MFVEVPVSAAPPVEVGFSSLEALEGWVLDLRLNFPRIDLKPRDSLAAGAGCPVSDGEDLERVVSSEGLGATDGPVMVVPVSPAVGKVAAAAGSSVTGALATRWATMSARAAELLWRGEGSA